MQGVDRHRICFSVFAGSKKCTRNSTDCLRCLRVLKKVPISVERVLCLRVQKNAPAMVLHVVILSVAKDLAGCANILWFGDLEILEFLDLAPPRHNKYTYSALGLIATFTSFRMTGIARQPVAQKIGPSYFTADGPHTMDTNNY